MITLTTIINTVQQTQQLTPEQARRINTLLWHHKVSEVELEALDRGFDDRSGQGHQPG